MPKQVQIMLTIPAMVVCEVEQDHDGVGAVVSVIRIEPAQLAPRDVEECLDNEGRLAELDK